MSKKATLSFNFREDLTSLDYQKIIVEQNNTIINLLSMQQDNLIHGGLNSIVKSNYAEALKPYVLKQGSDLDLKKIEENLSEQNRVILANFRRRKENGENVYKAAKNLGLESFFNEDE